MKKLFLLLTLIMGFGAFSQGLTLGETSPQPLKLEKGKIYRNGEQIPSYQVKQVMASNLHSLKLYKQAKSKEALGGFLFGAGATSVVVDLAIGVFSDADYPTILTYAGIGAVAISIPILSGRAKKVEEAVNSYNESLKNTSSTDFSINAVSNHNGIGIQIRF